LENTSSSSSPKSLSVEESIHERVLLNESMKSQFLGYNINQRDKAPTDDITYPSISIGVSAAGDCSAVGNSQIPMLERRAMGKRVSRKSHSEVLRREDKDVIDTYEEASKSGTTHSTSNFISSKEALIRHKVSIFEICYFTFSNCTSPII
jgi:hypothetical protein